MKTAFPLVYVSSSCFPYESIKDLLTFCKEKELINLELTGSLTYTEKTLTILKNNANNFNFLIHNYFPPSKNPLVINLASNNPEIRKKSLHQCLESIKICHQLSIPFYSVHAGFLVDLQPGDLGKKQSDLPFISRETGLKIFNDSIAQLLNGNVDILIENNVNSRENLVNGRNQLYLLAEPEETLNFFRQFNHPRLGLLVDLGHLNVSAQQLHFDKYEYLEILAPWIKAFHLSRNNGTNDQGLPFNKDEWFIETLKKFPTAAKIIEINKQNKLSDLVSCIKIVNNL